MKQKIPLFIGLGVIVVAGLWLVPKSPSSRNANTTTNSSGISTSFVTLSGDGLADGQPIPKQYTCDGANQHPALAWSSVPPATKNMAITMIDTDAPGGNFVHWLAWNIPARGYAIIDQPIQGVEGKNSTGKPGYSGPCPPSGTHQYTITLYGLRTDLELSTDASLNDFQKAIEGQILTMTTVTVTHQR